VRFRTSSGRSPNSRSGRPALAEIRVGGLRVEVAEIAGDPARRPCVLLHEGLGSVGLWRDFPGAVHAATGRRVIAFSRFGHGRSDPPAERRTTKFFHDEALDILPTLLARLDARKPLLIGHSDGGSIALIYAAHYALSGLVLLAPHVFVEDITVEAIRGTRGSFVNGDLRERMGRHHADPDAAFWGWCDVWLDPKFRAWDLTDEVRHVTAPLLLIQGADDPYGSLEQLDRIERDAEGPVERLVVSGGHSPHLEQPATVVAAIAAFARALQ
jgi:pimeloyl-ACP methyl ester carboxylesterase